MKVVRTKHSPWPISTPYCSALVNEVLIKGPLWAVSETGGQTGEATMNAPMMSALEQEFARYCGTRYALACNGGTSALHMALVGVGVQPGDEVITTAFSFLATPAAIIHAGAKPVFVDIEPDTFNINPDAIRSVITSKTKAILPVHLHGLPANMDAIGEIAREFNIPVVEDACQAPGATYRGTKTGCLGAAAAFSLNGTKTFAAGEGGLMTTNSTEVYERANVVRMVGEYTPRYHELPAWNYRMNELTAAFALGQLRQILDPATLRAQYNGKRLCELLRDVKNVTVPTVSASSTHVFHKFRLRLAPHLHPMSVVEELRSRGVEACFWGIGYNPLPYHPMFHVSRFNEYPVTEHTLAHSFIVGSETYPLCAQVPDLMDEYAEVIREVVGG